MLFATDDAQDLTELEKTGELRLRSRYPPREGN
jgi:hypothetical protein